MAASTKFVGFGASMPNSSGNWKSRVADFAVTGLNKEEFSQRIFPAITLLPAVSFASTQPAGDACGSPANDTSTRET